MSQRGEAVAAWESLFRAQVTVMRALAAEFPSREISLNEYDVMFNLTKQPGRRSRLRELNRHMLLTQPSVSRLVDRMVARELLVKENDPADGRGAVVVLTDAGYELFRTVAVSHMESITSHVGGALNSEELAQLESLCDKLRLATAEATRTENRAEIRTETQTN